MSQSDGSADHIEQTVQSIAELHVEHDRDTRLIQKFANDVTRTLGRPDSVISIAVLMVLWMLANALAPLWGASAVDAFPFPYLELFAAVSAFIVTLLILTTQRHEQDVARRRDQLTVNMAVLSEKKIAKVIALIEEQRRDSPLLASREDAEAVEMREPSDPRATLERIEDSELGDDGGGWCA